MRNWTTCLIACAALASACGVPRAEDRTPEIRALLDQYVQAVNRADLELLQSIWLEEGEASYVNPGERLSSDAALANFWRTFLQGAFSQRQLVPQNIAIHVNGNAAWAVFDWEFTATMADGQPYRARGWETQVYTRTDDGWRIAHVHYSVPVTPQ